MSKQPTITIVIPAYNEERHLKGCLDSIARQSETPEAVIVVDNNSTDKTAKIAASYPFVTVLKEPVQGLIAARNRGFNAAKTQLYARINADVQLDPDWVYRVKWNFLENQSLDGLTGPAYTILFPDLRFTHTRLYSWGYLQLGAAYFRTPVMWGANMIMTSEMWQKIKPFAHKSDAHVHEDEDLSLLIAAQGGWIHRDNYLTVSTGERSYHYWPKYKEYMSRMFRTKAIHKQAGFYDNPNSVLLSRWHCYPILAFMILPMAIFSLSSLLFYPFTQMYRRLRRV